ncbi:MAG: peptide MFS transporter [Bacteroidales bacterium]|jgi:POT family proton-dependent oligopeptide transporter|nr:peptide MFS transporter [Bacteroidales bacterium]
MFKGHPKGLYVFLFANMGERFGYYTMLAIFILFLQAKFGMNAEQAGAVYGTFLFGVYFIPLIGGIIADRVLGFSKTITLGILLMIAGYFFLAQPGSSKIMIYVALGIISVGTGFFKGNLQALVGKLYDDANLNKFRDAAFNLFYMGINIGAFFAPSAANKMSNWILGKQGLSYNANIPSMAHDYLDTVSKGGVFENTEQYTEMAKSAITGTSYQFTNLSEFSTFYIDTLSESYSYGFGLAIVSIIFSLTIFLVFRKSYKHVDIMQKHVVKAADDKTIELTPKQSKKRMTALGLVFIVNVFFWMAFHQNGFTLTIFARDYTVTEVSRLNYAWFDLQALLPIIAAIIGFIMVLGKKNKPLIKMIGAGLVVVGSAFAYYTISNFDDSMPISPMIFQHFNPIFIVFVTPVIIGVFTMLRKRGKEPSSPRKIGIGLLLAALSFMIMIIVSFNLGSAQDFMPGAMADALRVTPYWLIATYFSLTISELFYSPIGISFVSKVAPPKWAGFMQGGWLGSTAIGNLLAGLIGPFWQQWEMWQFFALLVGMLLLSAAFIFAIMKTLERATE